MRYRKGIHDPTVGRSASPGAKCGVVFTGEPPALSTGPDAQQGPHTYLSEVNSE